MARRRRRGKTRRWHVLLALAVLAASLAYFVLFHLRPPAPTADGGQPVGTAGLRVVQPARDPQLGVEADALVLIRTVEMRQWREDCAGSKCDYQLVWSEKPIDSQAFRDAAGHANPAAFPFASARFPAGEVRRGSARVDAAGAA